MYIINMKKKLIVLISILCILLAGCSSNNTNIGIIGGADGPTSIFLATSVNRLGIVALIAIIIGTIAVLAIIYLIRKKK